MIIFANKSESKQVFSLFIFTICIYVILESKSIIIKMIRSLSTTSSLAQSTLLLNGVEIDVFIIIHLSMYLLY